MARVRFICHCPGRPRGGDDDFDLVLVTHTNILVVELKNWYGKLLESDGEKWYVDGQCRDTSPVAKANLNAKRLASLLKQKLGAEFDALCRLLRRDARQNR